MDAKEFLIGKGYFSVEQLQGMKPTALGMIAKARGYAVDPKIWTTPLVANRPTSHVGGGNEAEESEAV